MAPNKAIYLTDMSQCASRQAIVSKSARGCWRAVPYDLGEIRGTLLVAGPESEAAPITLSLKADGWHAIHVGLWPQYGLREKPHLMLFKLTGDAGFVPVAAELQTQYEVDEVYWKTADLTGQDLLIGQFPGGFRAGIAYVKLTPLTPAAITALQADRRRTDTRRLIATVDNHGLYYHYRHTGEGDIQRFLEPFRDTDFGRIIWNNGGSADAGCFPTKVGRVANQDCECFPRNGDRLIAENMRMYLEKGIDTLAVARDYTRSLGLEFHCSLRMGAFQFQPPHDEVFTSPFYLAHPEWHCRDSDGAEVSRLSYAFPQVQDHVLALLEELAGYQPDGLTLIFVRGGPYMLYEEPLLQGFRQRTGKEACLLPENDPDFIKYRAGVMTDFIRRVRQLCDRNSRPGKKMALSAIVYKDEINNLAFALDVGTWVREGLVDFLLPYAKAASSKLEPVDLDYFAGLVQGTNCGLYPEITRPALYLMNALPARRAAGAVGGTTGLYKLEALKAYDKSAHGASFWDVGAMWTPRQWSMIRRLGHREEIAGYEEGEGRFFRSLSVKTVGGYRLDKYTPHWAY